MTRAPGRRRKPPPRPRPSQPATRRPPMGGTIGDPNQQNPLFPQPRISVEHLDTSHRRPLMATRPTAARDDQPTPSTEASSPAGPRELPLVALRETVIFPEMIVPLQVGREKSVNALNAAVAEGGPIALVTQRQPEQEDIESPSELYTVGTLAKIAQVVQLQDGTVRAIVQGQTRLRVHGFSQSEPYLRAVIEELPDASPDGVEVQALMRTVQAQIEQYVANGAPVPP